METIGHGADDATRAGDVGSSRGRSIRSNASSFPVRGTFTATSAPTRGVPKAGAGRTPRSRRSATETLTGQLSPDGSGRVVRVVHVDVVLFGMLQDVLRQVLVDRHAILRRAARRRGE